MPLVESEASFRMHQQQQPNRAAGRSDTAAGYSSYAAGSVSFNSSLSRSRNNMGEEPGAGAYSAPKSGFTSRSKTTPNMSSSIAATSSPVLSVPPTAAKTMPNLMHAKLHKRAGSGSGSGSGSTPVPGQAAILTSTNTTEPFPDIGTPAQSPRAKVKPYLRKLSSTKDDQGRIDLSKSLVENERLAGLGIQDFSSRTATDVVFAPRKAHARTTSVGSQMSNTSSSYRPHPFVHPMRQAPRPYTPTTRSRNSSPQGGEDDEFAEEEPRPSFAIRPRRSESNSSTQIAPTPLSKTITAAELSSKARITSPSQSNLSIISTRSSKPTGSRRNTARSQEQATSPSSRTSIDRPFGPRRSDTEAQTRDERIQAARRKFQEKEADKDRKAEKDAVKRREAEEAKELRRQEKQRRASDVSERQRPQRPGTGGRTGSALGMVSSLAYEPTTPRPSPSEKQTQATHAPHVEEKPGFFSRLFNCGGSRK